VTLVAQTSHAMKGMLLNSACLFLHQNTSRRQPVVFALLSRLFGKHF
jgi:hypothetical protein